MQVLDANLDLGEADVGSEQPARRSLPEFTGEAMSVFMISYQVADDGVAEVVGAIDKAFAALDAQQPAGIRYAYLRRAGSTEFVALLELADGVENPLPGIAEARQLQSTVAKWAAGSAPTPRPFEVLGSYRVLE
jgi:hypothetical protein